MRKSIVLLLSMMFFISVYSQYTDGAFNMPTSNQIILNLDQTFQKDTSIVLNLENVLYGFSVSGKCTLNTNKSIVRILLSDDCNNEHLVYENYILIADSNVCDFSNIGIETSLLDSIVPIKMQIQITDAELYISKINYTTNNHNASPNQIQSRRNAQNNAIATQLNNNLRKNNMTWRAGVTFVSSLSYEEKKALFGTDTLPNLYGIEYYKEGVYVSPDYEYSLQEKSSSQYVDNFDWRNRHGKNWISPIKSQGACGSCWAMAAVAQVEAYINLYYNRILNYDLSEQEVVSACDSFPYNANRSKGCSGGYTSIALKYMKNYGIVTEDCLPYQDYNYDGKSIVYGRVSSLPINSNVSYTMKCENPNEIIRISNYKDHRYTFYTDSLKSYLLKGPYIISYCKWRHAMLLVGFKTISTGDSICYGENTDVILAPETMNGTIAFTIKNSWGTDWGDNGYGYLVIGPSMLNNLFYSYGKIISLIYDDNDILCLDNDGDGYYFWGIGTKPSNLPAWIPNEADGDDSNAQFGPMNKYGYLMDLNPDNRDTIFINEATNWDNDNFIWQHVVVKDDGVLNITSNIKCYKGVEIVVKDGGRLIIDAGVLENVNLKILSDGELYVNNGGIIKKYKNFKTATNAKVLINNGVIN